MEFDLEITNNKPNLLNRVVSITRNASHPLFEQLSIIGQEDKAKHWLPITVDIDNECPAFFTTFPAAHYISAYPYYTLSHLPAHLDYLGLIATSSSYPDVFNRIKGLTISYWRKEEALVSQIRSIIDDGLRLMTDNNSNLYLRKFEPKKQYPSLIELINGLDKETAWAIKTGQLSTGFAAVRECLLDMKCGLGAQVLTSRSREKSVTYFDGAPCWYLEQMYNYPNGSPPKSKVKSVGNVIDDLGILPNAILSNFFLLLAHTNLAAEAASVYQTLRSTYEFEFTVQSLGSLIELLSNQNNEAALKEVMNDLAMKEPYHPSLLKADRALRRLSIFSGLGGSDTKILSLQDLSGIEFEKFLADVFRKQGFKVDITSASGDFGADILIESPNGTRVAIQAKRYKSKVNLKAVQEVAAAVRHYASDFGIVITSSGYFPSAIELARSNNIELWGEDELLRFLSGDWQFSMLFER